jgi:hypothetical protein
MANKEGFQCSEHKEMAVLGVAEFTCNPSTQEDQAGGSREFGLV